MGADDVRESTPTQGGPCAGVAEREARDARRQKALDLWLDGVPFSTIGERLGIAKTTAWDDVKAAIEGISFDPEVERKRDIMRLERLIRFIFERASKGDDDFAMDRLAGKLLPLKAKLLGTLAPEKVELSGGHEIVLEVRGTDVARVTHPADTDSTSTT